MKAMVAQAASDPTSRYRLFTGRHHQRGCRNITALMTPPIMAKATTHIGHAGARLDRSIRFVNPKFRAIEYPLATFRFVNLSTAKW
jgi:hypothetical protein